MWRKVYFKKLEGEIMTAVEALEWAKKQAELRLKNNQYEWKTRESQGASRGELFKITKKIKEYEELISSFGWMIEMQGKASSIKHIE